MNPRQITIFKDELLVADCGNNRIQIFDLNGQFLRQFKCITPNTVAVYTNGNIVVGREKSKLISVHNSDGVFLRKFSHTQDDKKFNSRMMIDSKNNVYISDHITDEIRIFTKKGRFVSCLHRQNVSSKSTFHCLTIRHGISTMKVLTSENVLVHEFENHQSPEDNEYMYYKCYWIGGNLLMYNTQHLI